MPEVLTGMPVAKLRKLSQLLPPVSQGWSDGMLLANTSVPRARTICTLTRSRGRTRAGSGGEIDDPAVDRRRIARSSRCKSTVREFAPSAAMRSGSKRIAQRARIDGTAAPWCRRSRRPTASGESTKSLAPSSLPVPTKTMGLPPSSASSGRTVIGCGVPTRVLGDAQQRGFASGRRDRVVQVEAPDVAQHVAAVGLSCRVVVQRVVDEDVDLGQPARRGRVADTGRRSCSGSGR